MKEETKETIKVVSWIIFQVLTFGSFIEKVSLDNWMWKLKD